MKTLRLHTQQLLEPKNFGEGTRMRMCDEDWN